MFKKSCQILVYKSERKLPWKKFWQFGYTLRGCPEFTFSKNWGICQVIKKGRKHWQVSAPVHFQAMPDLEKSRWFCIECIWTVIYKFLAVWQGIDGFHSDVNKS